MKRRYGLLGSLTTICTVWLACAPSPEDESALRGSSTGSGGSGATGGGASGAGSGSNAGSGGGLDPLGPGFGTGTDPDGGVSSESPCAENVFQPESIEEVTTTEEVVNCTAESPEPIALYIVLDNSGSMSDNNKWTDAVNAITAFVNSDLSAGNQWVCVNSAGVEVPPPADLAPPGAGSISVAIQYFHPVGTTGDECDGTGHRTPAVPMGPLPGNAINITNSLASTGPNGDTPTVGALTGGVAYCQDYQTANPDERCVTVLVTDGQPNGCGLDSSCGGFGGGNDCVDPNAQATLTPIAANAYNDPNNSVITFTVGMQGITAEGFVLLDAIAVAGGSDCTPGSPGGESCNVSTSGSQGFLDALNTIRDTVQVTGTSSQTVTTTNTVTTTLPCEWQIPEPAPGETFDKNRVNVEVGIGTTEPQTLGNVPALADCEAVGGGWYYDNPDNPTRIHACPLTCQVLTSSSDVRVNVLVGCVTQVAILR